MDHLCGSSEPQAVPASAGWSYTWAHGRDGREGSVPEGHPAWLDPSFWSRVFQEARSNYKHLQFPTGQSKSQSTGDASTASRSFSHLASSSLMHGSRLPTMRCLLWQIKYGRKNMLLRILSINMPWAHKPFCVPHFLITSNMLHSALLTFPWVPRGSLRHLLIREWRGCQTKEGTVRKQ